MVVELNTCTYPCLSVRFKTESSTMTQLVQRRGLGLTLLSNRINCLSLMRKDFFPLKNCLCALALCCWRWSEPALPYDSCVLRGTRQMGTSSPPQPPCNTSDVSMEYIEYISYLKSLLTSHKLAPWHSFNWQKRLSHCRFFSFLGLLYSSQETIL